MASRQNIGGVLVVMLVLSGTTLLVWLGTRDQKPAGTRHEQIMAKPPVDDGKSSDEPTGPAVRGIIKGVDGNPRGDARVVLASSYERQSMTRAMQDPSIGYLTHKDGRFAVPLPRGDWVAVFFSDEGHAQVSNGEYREGMDVVLRPWAKVEGVVMEGKTPVEGAEIVCGVGRKGVPNYFYYLEFERRTRTDAAGRYAFEKVPPGANFVAWVQRGRVPVNKRGQGLALNPGETKTVDFGGIGRPVTAKVVAAGLAAPLLFRGALWPLDMDVSGDWEGMDHAQRQKLARVWMTSAAGQQALNLMYPIAFEADVDGNVRVEDVPAGFYRVVITGTQHETRGGSEIVSNVERFIHVPEKPAGEALSLGTIEAPVKMRVSAGTPAPEIVARALDGSELKLSSFKDRHVLLVIWAEGKPRHDLKALRAAQDLYGDDPRLALVELTTADSLPPLLGGGPWAQGRVDVKALPPEYLGAGAPVFLIGPDGSFLAWDVPGRKAYGVVDDALRPRPGVPAKVKLIHEQNPGRDGGPPFAFKDVPPPSKDDLGGKATWAIIAGDKDRGPVSALHDGEVPDRADDPTRNLSFSYNNLQGRIRADLGHIVSVKQVNSYSWHPGSRASQVYRLYGSAGDGPAFNAEPTIGVDPAKAGWTLIANVDTRTPEGIAGGQVGVSIGETGGEIGRFRYLLFIPFSSGIRDGWELPFFSEIDVVGE